MRRGWLAGGAAATVLLVSACGSSQSTPAGNADGSGTTKSGYLAKADVKAPRGGTLRMEVASDVVEASGMDPQTATLAASWSILSLSYQTLTTTGPNYAVRPMLATSWREPSPTRYIFQLRRGVRFGNGREMTSDDVVGSMRRLMAGQSVWRTQLGPVRSVTKRGAHTVEIDLTRPYTPLLAALANIDAAILPIKELDAKTFHPATQMLGTGPFQMTGHRQDVSWTFRRNPHYWQKGEPALGGVDIKIVSNDSTRVADLRSGSADVVELSSTDDPANLKGVPNTRVVVQSTPNFYYLALNARRPGSKLANQRVREALDIALDRRQIASDAMSGLATPTGVVPAGLPHACTVSALPTSRRSLADAKKLLAAAGASHLAVSIMIFNDDPLESQIAQVVQQQLQRLGIQVRLQSIDPGTFTKDFDANPSAFDAAITGLDGYADPGMVTRWWNAKAAFSTTFMDNDPRLDTLIDDVDAERGARRDDAIKRLCASANENSTMIPLVTYPAILGYRTDKVSPAFYAQEGYGEPWRQIADFRMLGGSR